VYTKYITDKVIDKLLSGYTMKER